MAYMSASTYNKMSKCEMAYYLSKTQEGKEHIAKQGNKYALANGTIMHNACQTLDVDRFIHKMPVPTSQQEIFDRYNAAYTWFFTDETNIKKEKIKPEQTELWVNQIHPTLQRWLCEEDLTKQASLKANLNALQTKMDWAFTVKKPIHHYYQESYEVFDYYVKNNPLDVYGDPLEFCIEKAYNVAWGESDVIPGYVDGRYVFNWDGRRIVLLKEMKTSATEYKPEDCGIDSQMSFYVYLESLDGTPLEDIYVCMYQLPTGICTITQRSEENIDFLLRNIQVRMDRANALQRGDTLPLCICGSNSYENQKVFCDYKEICPVYNMIKTQPTPIILGTKKGK